VVPKVPSDSGETDEEIDEFYRRMSEDLVRYARRRCLTGPAEDFVHDVMEKMIRRWDTITPATRDRYAYRAVGNTISSWLTRFRNGREDLVAEPDQPPPRTPDNPVELAVLGADLAERVADLIAGLPKAEADVLRRWAEGMPPEEIARVRGVTVKTARTELASARRKLRLLLQDQEGQS
jgi:RNA polymerase sigma factor (sigma-70 family)